MDNVWKYFFKTFKWLIFFGSLFFLVDRIIFQQEYSNLFSKFNFSKSINLLYLFLTLCLMFVNWGIEAFKWKYAISSICKITFNKAYAAVLAGTSVSVFMPNRTGEFIGRVFVVPQKDRGRAMFISIASSFSQLIVTIITGTIALFILNYYYPNNFVDRLGFNYLLYSISIIILIISLFFYFKINWFTYFFENWKFLKKYSDTAQILKTLNSEILFNFILLSIFRYSIFIVQFYLLIYFFGIELNFWSCAISSMLTFYIVTIIPTFSLSEIGIRGSIAVVFFGIFTNQYAEIISASTLLWITNVGIPALIGNVFVAGYKVSKNKF